MSVERSEGESPLLRGEAFIRDSSAPNGYRFECTSCSWPECRRVSVKRPTGGHYQTEFAACGACHTMYHWPGDVPVLGRQRHSAAQIEKYVADLGQPYDSGLSAEQLKAIGEAADRARKGRSWKARKR
jgi:hypothetical protein